LQHQFAYRGSAAEPVDPHNHSKASALRRQQTTDNPNGTVHRTIKRRRAAPKSPVRREHAGNVRNPVGNNDFKPSIPSQFVCVVDFGRLQQRLDINIAALPPESIEA
jgi:hypothetical protein